jgi:hypothetical protein
MPEQVPVTDAARQLRQSPEKTRRDYTKGVLEGGREIDGRIFILQRSIDAEIARRAAMQSASE